MKITSNQSIVWVGALSGIFSFVYFLTIYQFGADPFYSFPQKLIIVPEGLFLLLGLYLYRKNKTVYDYSFGEGLIKGTQLTLYAIVVGIGLVYGYLKYDRKPMDVYLKDLRLYMKFQKEVLIKESSAKVYEENLKAIEDITPESIAVNEAIGKLTKGIMFSILISLVFRRKLEV